jgi:hypothetical protein
MPRPAPGSSQEVAAARRRPACKACLDWSVRRSHLAGALDAALLERMYDLGWAAEAGSRVVSFTPAGLTAVRAPFIA